MKIAKRLLTILLLIIITLGLLEVALIAIDPLGIAYFQQLIFLDSFYYGEPTGQYGLSPGTYSMHHWTATVNEDGTRYVPAADDRCTVVFVGDSLTWGWGSDDADTFVNLLAEALNINAINAGMIGYNSQNVAETLASYTGYDFAVYFMFANDHEVRWQKDRAIQQPAAHHFMGPGMFQSDTPLLVMYLLYLARVIGTFEPETSIDNFHSAMSELATDDNLITFAFDTPLTTEAQEYIDVEVIDWYTQRISYIDFHPNADGNQEIAEAMLPILEPRVEMCAQTMPR